MKEKIDAFMDLVKKRNGHEPEFIQAVQEVAETVIPYIAKHEIYNDKPNVESRKKLLGNNYI